MKIFSTLPALALLFTAALAVPTSAAPQEAATAKPAQAAGETAKPAAAKPAAAKPAAKKPGSRWAPKKLGKVDLTKIESESVPLTPAELGGSYRTGTRSQRPADYDPAEAQPHPPVTFDGVPIKDPEPRAAADIKIVFEEGSDTYDFGSLKQGETPSHVFTLRAEGTEDLVIKRIKASCGCTLADTAVISPSGERVAWAENLPIAPGSTIEVNTSLKTEAKRGNVSTNVAIYSNDGESAVRRLSLRANVRSVIEVEPTSLNFGQVMAHQEATGVINLSSSEGIAFSASLADDRALEGLTVEMVAIEPDADGRSSKWEARLTLAAGLKEGIKNYPLRFITDIPIASAGHSADDGHDHGAAPATHEYRGYAVAQIQGMIFAKPNYCAFGMMRPGEKQERSYTIRTRDEAFTFPAEPEVRVAGLKNEEVFRYGDNLLVETGLSEDKKAIEVTVKVRDLPEDFEGSFNGFIEIDVNHPMTTTVSTRFTGIARPGVNSPARGR